MFQVAMRMAKVPLVARGIPGDGEVVVRLRLHLRDGLPVDRDDARALVVVDAVSYTHLRAHET